MCIESIYNKLQRMYPRVPFKIKYNRHLNCNVILLKRYFYMMKIFRVKEDYCTVSIVDEGTLRGLPCTDINYAFDYIERELRKLRLKR